MASSATEGLRGEPVSHRLASRASHLPPQGHTSISWTPAIDNRKNEVIKIKCSIKDCQSCPSRSLCTHSTRYPRRTITVRCEQQHQALQRARARAKTEEFKTLYARRAGVEGTISEAGPGDGPTTFPLHWSRKDASSAPGYRC